MSSVDRLSPPVAGASGPLTDAARLAALAAVDLLDAPGEETLDRLASLATRTIGAPVALVSLVTDDRQFFTSCSGLTEPLATERQTPLSHSFCQHVVQSAEPLVVEDAREHPVLRANLAVRDINVIAYAGMPLTTSDGLVLGSFCVIDHRPRRWTPEELTVLEDLAVAAMAQLELRRMNRRSSRFVARLLQFNEALVAINAHGRLDPTLRAISEQATALIGARRAGAQVTIGTFAPRHVAVTTGPEGEVPDDRLTTPLIDLGGMTIGEIWVAGPTDEGFTAQEEALLAQLGATASAAVDKAIRFEREHAIAALLQRSLLPGRLPDVPGLDIATTYRPAGAGVEVGGDFYDLLELPEGMWGAVVGDVCGKGPRAAALTGLARHTIRALAQQGRPPAEILEGLNEAILRDDDELRFCTAVYAQVRPHGDGIDVVLAAGGHPCPLLLRSDGAVDAVDVGGRIIGIEEELDLEEVTVHVGPGEALVLYTDGLTESVRGPAAEVEELAPVLREAGGAAAAEINELLEAWAIGRAGDALPDDLALLTLAVPVPA